VPRLASLRIALTKLRDLFEKALQIEWQENDFTYDTLQRDTNVLNQLLACVQHSEESDKEHYLNVYHKEVRIYPFFVSLCEPYEIARTDSEQQCLQLMHFMLIAKCLYASEKNDAAMIDFYRFAHKKIAFESFAISMNDTQFELAKRYRALIQSVEYETDRKRLRKTLLDVRQTQQQTIQNTTDPLERFQSALPISTQTVEQESDRRNQVKVKNEQQSRAYFLEVQHHSDSPQPLHQIRADIILGSRIELLDSLHLPLSTRHLRDDEAKQVVTLCIDALKQKKSLSAAAALLMMITTKSVTDLEKLMLCTSNVIQHDPVEHLDLERGVWYKPSLMLNNAFQPSDAQKSWLLPHRNAMRLPLPRLLVDALRWHMHERTLTHCSFKRLLRHPLKQKLQGIMQQVTSNRPLHVSKLRSYLFLKVAQRLDAQSAMLLFNAAEFDNTHHLYYLALRESFLIQLNLDVLKTVLNVPMFSPPQESDAWIGSHNVLDVTRLKPLLQARFHDLQALLMTGSSALIDTWNQLNVYCALMCVVVSNHRIRNAYTFTAHSFDLEARLMIVSDKQHQEDSAVRVLPLPDALHAQLTAFDGWRRDLLPRLKSAMPSLSTLSPFDAYFTVLESGRMRALGHQDVSDYLGEAWTLPNNVFRHFYCQTSRDDLFSSKLAKEMMGHVNAGQHPLSHFSLLSMSDLQAARPSLDAILNDKLGFQCLPRPPACAFAFDVPLVPAHRTTSTRERIRYVRRCIEPRLDDIKQSHDLSALQRQVVHKIMFDTNTHKDATEREHLIYLSQRFFAKLASRLDKSWHVTSGVSIEEKSLQISTLDLTHQKLARGIKQQLSRQLITVCVGDPVRMLRDIVLRSLIYSPPRSTCRLQSIVEALVTHQHAEINGLVYVKLSDFERLFLDPLSAVTLLKMSPFDVAARDVVKAVNQCIRRVFDLSAVKNWVSQHLTDPAISDADKCMFKQHGITHYDAALMFFNRQRSHHQTSVVHAYQSDRIASQPLSHVALTRLFTNRRYVVNESHQEAAGLSVYLPPKFNAMQAQQVREHLSQIRDHFDALGASPSKKALGECILAPWRALLALSDVTLSRDELRERCLHHYPLIVAMSFEYLYQVSQRRGNAKHRNVALNTLRAYFSEAVMPSFNLLWSVDTLSFDSEEWSEHYALLLHAVPEEGGRRNRKAQRLRDFHRECQAIFHLPAVDWRALEPSLAQECSPRVNANVLTEKHYQHALKCIELETRLDATEREHAAFMLILSYRAGLRPAEIVALDEDNFMSDLSFLSIRTNAHDRVKTLASNRQIPLSLFLNEDETNCVQVMVDKARRRGGKNTCVFYSVTLPHQTLKSRCTSYLTQLLKSVTADGSIRLYHCRHSFANYLYLLMINTERTGLTETVKAWARCSDDAALSAFRARVLQAIVGDEIRDHIVLFAIAWIMGHQHPRMTLQHYIHVLDIQHYSECAANYSLTSSIEMTVDRASIKALLCMNDASFRQRLSREKAVDWKYASMLKTLPKLGELTLISQPELDLSDVNALNEKSSETTLDELLQINDWLHAHLYRDVHHLHEEDETDRAMINAVSDELNVSLLKRMKETRAYFTNHIAQSTLVNYRDKRAVHRLLEAFSILSDAQRSDVIADFVDMNHGNAVYLMTNTQQVQRVARLTLLHARISDQSKRVKIKNRLEARYQVDFCQSVTSKKSLNQQLAYVCVIVALHLQHFA
jgi:integrase